MEGERRSEGTISVYSGQKGGKRESERIGNKNREGTETERERE